MGVRNMPGGLTIRAHGHTCVCVGGGGGSKPQGTGLTK